MVATSESAAFFFTVIIPTYNRAPLLKRALDALRRQTFKRFEVIVVDDGSTDETEEVVQEFGRFLAIRYFKQENWGGPAKPRNVGMQHAVGEWLVFLDADDWFYENKLEEVYRLTSSNDVIYHHLDMYDVKERKTRLLKAKAIDRKRPFKDLVINGNKLLNSGVSVRAALTKEVGEFSQDKKLIAVEDFDYWIRLARYTNKFCLINKPLGAYYLGHDQISAPTERFLNAQCLVLANYSSYLSKGERNRLAGTISYIKAMHFLKRRERHSALRPLLDAFIRGGFWLKMRVGFRMIRLVIFNPIRSVG